jgi:3-(3-hydroxy-phenyl)propionate hydroxylase
MARHEAQIIIVGAGPVGLVTALRLHSLGIACTVVEAESTVADELRASTFHPPTLDMLDEYGLAAPLIAQGLKAPSWQIRMHETGERVVFDLGVLASDTRHPFRLQCEQARLCRLLVERLAGLDGVTLLFGMSAERIEQDDDGVTVHARTSEGETTRLTGRLLIGADGAKSSIREAVGMPLHGETYPETTILATTRFPFQDHIEGLSNVNYVWTQRGTYSLLRLPSLWRCSLYPDVGESIEAAITPDAIERKLQRIVPRDVGYDVMEVRPYRVHKRIVDDYRIGRVLLVGDAAHINSPSGGMGMNGGIHDAFALTDAIQTMWPNGDLARLDSYTRRRRPVAAEEILEQAHENRSRMQERDVAKRRAALDRLQAIAADPDLLRAHLLRSSMIAGLRRAAAVA